MIQHGTSIFLPGHWDTLQGTMHFTAQHSGNKRHKPSGTSETVNLASPLEGHCKYGVFGLQEERASNQTILAFPAVMGPWQNQPKSDLTDYSQGVVWPNVIQAQPRPNTNTFSFYLRCLYFNLHVQQRPHHIFLYLVLKTAKVGIF